jgi:hypothetical protein
MQSEFFGLCFSLFFAVSILAAPSDELRTYPNGIVGIRVLVEEFLLILARHVRLPNIEFIINYSDYPQLLSSSSALGALFSMCKTDAHSDFLLPTYELMQIALGRRESTIFCPNLRPFSQRKSAVVWRFDIFFIFEEMFLISSSLHRGSDSNFKRFEFVRAAQTLNKSTGF